MPGDPVTESSDFYQLFPLSPLCAERKPQQRCSVVRLRAVRAPWTSQNICYGHEERKVTASTTRGVLDTSCLLGIVTFLADQATKKGVLVLYHYRVLIRPLPPIVVHHYRRRSGGHCWWWTSAPMALRNLCRAFLLASRRIVNPQVVLFLRDHTGKGSLDPIPSG